MSKKVTSGRGRSTSKRSGLLHGTCLTLGKITVGARVGSGAFGEVFRGRLWGTDVAIKSLKVQPVINVSTTDVLLPPKPEATNAASDVLAEIKKEIEILSQLRHPNVILYIGISARFCFSSVAQRE